MRECEAANVCAVDSTSTCWESWLKADNIEAEMLDVMVVSSLFSMQVLTHIPLTGVQAQNGKLWLYTKIWFGCVHLYNKISQ